MPKKRVFTVWRNVNARSAQSRPFGQPHSRQAFCEDCGEKTIMACPECQAHIRGYFHMESVFTTHTSPVPKYCINCGKPYPWQTRTIEALTDILKEGALPAEDVQTFSNALPDVLRDSPKTDSASLKIKRILGKLGKDTYDIAIKVLTDVATEAARKQIGL